MSSAVLRQFNRPPKRPLAALANAYLVVPAITELRHSWHRLHDLDRALAIRKIIQLDVSRRRLARELGFSEGLMRHLLKALKASSADQELARRNAISTNELVRRAEGRPFFRSADRQPVKAVAPAPQPKGDQRPASSSSRQIPPAAVGLLEMRRDCTGY